MNQTAQKKNSCIPNDEVWVLDVLEVETTLEDAKAINPLCL